MTTLLTGPGEACGSGTLGNWPSVQALRASTQRIFTGTYVEFSEHAIQNSPSTQELQKAGQGVQVLLVSLNSDRLPAQIVMEVCQEIKETL